MKKKYHKGNRLTSAFGFSLDGVKAAWKEEAAFRQVVVLGGIGLFLALCLPMTQWQRALWILPIGISWITELLNSSIENIVDLVSPEFHPLAKKAKDMGSAAQMFALTLLAVVWLLILLDIYR